MLPAEGSLKNFAQVVDDREASSQPVRDLVHPGALRQVSSENWKTGSITVDCKQGDAIGCTCYSAAWLYH